MLRQRIGFIGVGRMGSTLIRRILRKNLIPPQNIWACDKDEGKLSPLSKLRIKTIPKIEPMIKEVDVIFIAVKPQDVDTVLEDLKNELRSWQLIISIVAGLTTSYIIKKLGKKIPLVRAMPNMPALIGEGISAISPGEGVSPTEIKLAKEIFKAIGEVIEIPEEKQDVVTGLSGSGPAYVYTFIQGLIKGGLKEGLTEEIASKLAIQTTLGAAKMANKSKSSLDELKAAIISPGGTTAEGLKALEKGKFRDCLAQAVTQAAHRARELRK